ncbi:MAG: VWA domain-containing protein [Terriglobales bacterium]
MSRDGKNGCPGPALSLCGTADVRRFALRMVACVILLGWAAGAAVAEYQGTPEPSAQIDLVPLGYAGLSAAARQSGGSNLSVDFLDREHVLLTFNPKKLFKRLPECPSTHADRLVHAVVMEVPSGKVVRESDWYLHDLRRYVWSLGSGRVLLRRLNRLYEVNSNLEEKLVFDSPKELLWVSVTPDGKQIIVETSAGTGTQSDSRDGKARDDVKNKDAKSKEQVKVSFLDADSLAMQRAIDVRGMISLEGTSTGFADVRRQGGVWLVEFGNANIARVKARRAPNLLYSSANTLLIGRCSVSRDGYSVSAFTVAGTFLWRQHWEQCRYSPVARDSEDGSRFAVGTVTIRSASAIEHSGGDESGDEGLEQHIAVFDTATGNGIASVTAAPAVPNGQNVALSPEGRRLAVIAGTVMNVYELPEMSAGERARYIAVKADTPSLNVPPAKASKGDEASEPIYASAAALDVGELERVPETPVATPVASIPMTKTRGVGSEETPALTIRTGTQVVALDVVVTDNAGHLVKGLQQGDLNVSEDGKPQAVRYFREYADAQPAALAPRSALVKEKLPANVFSNDTQPAESGAVTVVLLDLLNTPMADQAYAQEELVKFLKNKPRDAKFALCTLGNRLQMIQGFTGEGGTLLAAAKGKKASQRHRPLQDPDTVLPTSQEAATATARFIPELRPLVESVVLQQSEARLVDADQRMFVTVDAFAHLARYLAGIPGRKNLVWLSGSFLFGIYPDPNGPNPFLEAHSYGENLKKVANLLGEAHVAVYPVDVRGLQTMPLFNASSNDLLAPLSMQGSAPAVVGGGPVTRGGGVRMPNASTAVPIGVMQDQLSQFGLSQMDEHATMDRLAGQTGGQAFYNTNGIAQAIKMATEQGSNYYALSYTPANKKYDGAYRKIKVTLAGKKYRLAYRGGYYAVDPFAPVMPPKDMASSLARAAMQQGSPPSRQIVFGARVVPVGKPRVIQNSTAMGAKASKKHKEKETAVEVQRYAIDHAVTFGDLRFSPGPDGKYHDVVNFMVTAFDDDGKLMASQMSQTVADLKPEVLKDIMAGGLRMHQEIDVPVKGVALRLGVEDVSNSHIGTLEIPLPVAAPPEGAAVARRPLPAVEPD